MSDMPKERRSIFVLAIVIILSLVAGAFVYQPLWAKISSFRPWSLGLDVAGGSFLVYEIDAGGVAKEDRDSVVRGLRDVIERRVNIFGVSEPRVYTERAGNVSRLVIELAGIKDVAQAIQLIGQTPFLDFREVVQLPSAATSTATSTKREELNIEFKPTALTGRYVKGAVVSFDSVTSVPEVNLEFTKDGAKLFEEITERNVGKPLAIFLDNNLIQMPVVREKITGGKAQITGQFSFQEAKQFVERFNAGALPAPITLINQQTISSDFGKDALQKAMLGGVFGTIAVIFFMMIYYRSLGIFASVALLMYIALTLAIFKIIPITLTLAGIAGFILSIGMAVDASILVFERTREEVRRGLTLSTAIEEGFRRAWTSIRDSNVSTLITSFVLYYFTSSFVKGFALALFIGVVVSMFSAITVTRTMLRVFAKNHKA